MYRLTLILAFAVLAVLPSPAEAHHGMVTGPECGTYEIHLEQDMTKGRTDSMLYSVEHSVGCKRYIMSNVVGTGRGESYGYAGQESNCVRYGREDTVRFFDYYYHEKIDPSSVSVKCGRYQGDD